MLEITLSEHEMWDEENEEFFYIKGQTLQLEHSLVSISKWESKWCKPFYSKDEKTNEEIIDYIKCMTLNEHVDDEVISHLSVENVKKINEYISAPMTATSVHEDNRGPRNREVMTSEVIYYYMVALNIPFECQYWHINRLMMLIKVCSIKNQSPKKMSKRDIMSRNSQLNAARRGQLHTKG